MSTRKDAPAAQFDDGLTPRQRAKNYGLTAPFTPEEFRRIADPFIPVPEPIGPAEQKVIDSFKPKIAAAQKTYDEALAEFKRAEADWVAALRADNALYERRMAALNGLPDYSPPPLPVTTQEERASAAEVKDTLEKMLAASNRAQEANVPLIRLRDRERIARLTAKVESQRNAQ